MVFQQGGNAVDAACAMLAATCTMWDVLSWGGETQALIYHPQLKKVIAINALGVAPTGVGVGGDHDVAVIGSKHGRSFGSGVASSAGRPATAQY